MRGVAFVTRAWAWQSAAPGCVPYRRVRPPRPACWQRGIRRPPYAMPWGMCNYLCATHAGAAVRRLTVQRLHGSGQVRACAGAVRRRTAMKCTFSHSTLRRAWLRRPGPLLPGSRRASLVRAAAPPPPCRRMLRRPSAGWREEGVIRSRVTPPPPSARARCAPMGAVCAAPGRPQGPRARHRAGGRAAPLACP